MIEPVHVTIESQADIFEDRYSRLRLSGWQPSILRAARILVVGAGALGNEVIKNLALLGAGSILIVDSDTVAISNLSRSILFRERDLGQLKAQIAAERARQINPDLQTAWLNGDVGMELGVGVFRRMDVVIGCLDNLAARRDVNRFCWLVNKSWVDGALNGMDGLLRVFVPNQGACFECGLTEGDYADLRQRYSCQGGLQDTGIAPVLPTTPTSASIIAAMQVEKVVRLLHQMSVPAGYEIVYSGTTNELLPIKLQPNVDCLAHEIAQPLVELNWATAKGTTARHILNEAQRSLGAEAILDLDREIVTGIACVNCGALEERIIPMHRLPESEIRCPKCASRRSLISQHRIDAHTKFLDLRLSELGIPPAHILRARCQTEYLYLELTGDLPAALTPNGSKG